MKEITVTTELTESFWMKVKRWLGLRKREEFKIAGWQVNYFKKGEILSMGLSDSKVRVL